MAHQLLIEGREPRSASSPARGSREVTTCLAALDEGVRAATGRVLESGALGLQPAFELGRLRDEEPFQQVAPIELECLAPLRRGDRSIKGRDVVPEEVGVEADLLIATPCHNALAHRTAQHVECFAERRASVFLVELWPEQRDEAVAPLKVTGGAGSKVGKQREPPGLCEEAADLAPVGRGQAQSAQHSEVDHGRPCEAGPRHGGRDAPMTVA